MDEVPAEESAAAEDSGDEVTSFFAKARQEQEMSKPNPYQSNLSGNWHPKQMNLESFGVPAEPPKVLGPLSELTGNLGAPNGESPGKRLRVHSEGWFGSKEGVEAAQQAQANKASSSGAGAAEFDPWANSAAAKRAQTAQLAREAANAAAAAAVPDEDDVELIEPPRITTLDPATVQAITEALKPQQEAWQEESRKLISSVTDKMTEMMAGALTSMSNRVAEVEAAQTSTAAAAAAVTKRVEEFENKYKETELINKAEMLKVMEDRLADRDKQMQQEIHQMRDRLATSSISAASSSARAKPEAAAWRPQQAQGPSEGAPFVPAVCYLRGWCRYKEENEFGMKEAEAVALAEQLKELLPQEVQRLIASMEAPFYKNRQITIRLAAADTEMAERVKSAFNKLLTDRKLRWKNREIYCVADMPEWRRQRNAALGKAMSLLEAAVPPEMRTKERLYPDWRAGQLYLDENCVGRYMRKTFSWQWDSTVLRKWPVVDVPLLVRQTEDDQ